MRMASSAVSSVVLQERDIAILRGLFEARVMKLPHITALYFDGKEEAAKKRVQKLKAAGFIRERKGRHPYEHAILSMTRQAFEALTSEGALTGYPAIGWKSLEKRLDVSEATLRHETFVLDTKAALAAAISADPTYSITEFSVWPRLCEFTIIRQSAEKVIRPDGLLRIQETFENGETDDITFFLEVDRGSESLDVLAGKASDYFAYLKSGDLSLRLGIEERAPFRVLMVFKTPTRRSTPSMERRNNAAERLLLRPEPFGNFIWLTTLEDLVRDPLGAIWITPSTYRDATKGTPFEVVQRREAIGPYARRPERERFVEEHVKRRRLLEE